MRALVVYESLFGNTHTVAEAVASGMAQARPDLDVRCLPVAKVAGAADTALGDVDLLVVGCPTHALGMSSVRSRAGQLAKDRAQDPERRHDPDAAGPGVRELMAVLPRRTPSLRAAAFDTRLASWFSGGAAGRIARGLRRAGAVVVGRPTGFIVEGMAGPLADGELERARAWGGELAAVLAADRPAGSELTGG